MLHRIGDKSKIDFFGRVLYELFFFPPDYESRADRDHGPHMFCNLSVLILNFFIRLHMYIYVFLVELLFLSLMNFHLNFVNFLFSHVADLIYC